MTVNVIETTNFRLQIIKFHTSNATKRAEFKRIIRPVARVTRMQLYIKLIAVHVKRRCFYLYQSNRNLRACQLHVYVYIGQKPRIHQKYTRILSVNQSSVKRQIELLRRKLTDERCNVKLVQMVVRCLASKSRGGHEDDRYKNDNLLFTLGVLYRYMYVTFMYTAEIGSRWRSRQRLRKHTHTHIVQREESIASP